MKQIAILGLLIITSNSLLNAQQSATEQQQKAITHLIGQYSEAREKIDTNLLKAILTTDIDQLVSNGEWRKGIGSAVAGMVKSSSTQPGTRTLKVESIKMLNSTTAIADCRYEITNADGTMRKMWSTFIVVDEKGKWKISAIRNMLPSNQ
jgi:ketosteroid isomerase-like protein